MVVLDVSIVNVALPSIRNDLGFSISGLQWVVNAYTITFGGLLLLGGRASDLLGRRRMFITGVLVFALASLAGALAPSSGLLVAARAAQGIGGAIVAPSTLAVLMTTFHDGTRTTARARHLGRHDGCRRQRGRDPRRHPHGRPRLALDLPGERARRRRDRLGGPAQPRARPGTQRGADPQLRPAWARSR